MSSRVRDLDRDELRGVVAEYAAMPEVWQRLVRHDPDARVYEHILRDRHLDVWLICWMPGHDTGFHDHDRSSGAVAVVEGSVLEERLVLGGPPTSRLVRTGELFDFEAAAIHRVTHAGRTPAVTLHAYSPPLRGMGAYVVQPSGTLQRRAMSYDEELRPVGVSL